MDGARAGIRCRRGGDWGFSLIEIMIVVFVIGLLASFAGQSLSRARLTTQKQRAQADLTLISSAVQQLAWDTGKWPSGKARSDRDVEVWDLSTSSAGLLSASSGYSGWNGPYLKKMPKDPWGNPYFFDPDYYVTSTKKVVVVGSFGPNKRGQNLYDSDDIYVIITEN